ncbi:hypothetical protein M427DRAFT_91987, partial [Gonapodya prolifera JEL478]
DTFKDDLKDVQLRKELYGTHSFQRGGCQYCYQVCQWDLQQVCHWGGWTADFKTLMVVRYLVGVHDERIVPRDKF